MANGGDGGVRSGGGESEGEPGRVNGVSARSGRRPEDDPRGATATRAMQRGWVVRGELGRAMLTSLPALARESSWLARVSTVLGRPVGCQVSGQVKLSLSLSVLILFSILQVCFEFGFETNSIYFASDNIFRS